MCSEINCSHTSSAELCCVHDNWITLWIQSTAWVKQANASPCTLLLPLCSEKDIFPDSSLAKRSDPVHLIVCAISLTCWREIIYHNSSTLLEVERISQFDLLWINVSGLQFWGQPRNLDCKTLPCVSHKNINFIYALNDAVNVLKVLNMYGFLSSAEHKRRSLTECWRCSFAYNESEWWSFKLKKWQKVP